VLPSLGKSGYVHVNALSPPSRNNPLEKLSQQQDARGIGPDQRPGFPAADQVWAGVLVAAAHFDYSTGYPELCVTDYPFGDVDGD